MENEVVEGASKLIDYGLLGTLLLITLGILAYGAKYLKGIVELFIKDKDDQIERANQNIQKRDDQLDGVLAQLATNSARQLDLHEHQLKIIEDIPERTVEKLQLALK